MIYISTDKKMIAGSLKKGDLNEEKSSLITASLMDGIVIIEEKGKLVFQYINRR